MREKSAMDVREAEVLLVEDDGNDVAIARHALRRGGLEGRIAVCRDGVEALDWLGLDGSDDDPEATAPPRVIFLDLRMPRMDGWEFLRELRRHDRTRSVPVVVLSASGREEDVRSSYRLGANSFVVKRFESGRPGAFLADAVRYWLDLNRAPS